MYPTAVVSEVNNNHTQQHLKAIDDAIVSLKRADSQLKWKYVPSDSPVYGVREWVGLAECVSPAGRLADGSAASFLPDFGVSGLFPAIFLNSRSLQENERRVVL